MAIKTVFAFFLVLAGFAVTSFAGTINLSNSKITLTGTGTIKVDPVETFWAGLTKNRRYPTILSGDLFALKLYRSSGTPKWMQCSKSASCTTSTCPRGQVMLNSKFSSCKTVVFRIRTLGKPDGQVVEAGDYVVMSFPFFGEARYFYCSTSTSGPCRATWGVSTPWPRRYWLNRNQAKFQIFAKNADEGKPIQYGDTVGFKYVHQSQVAWLYSDGSKIYARSCSAGNYHKVHCTKINSGFAFQIYKKI
ncbi:uncharacterized protein LOC110247586 [Exaiptasia diaphana]|uniref:Uncharacterized protein n=1 Tax=Exaiptasia diaphana TaxID=2652724 RepID=A0A913XTY2_EXADI|nr:uncharacterized protein LOC110247586 [Exaiptasia diaphana]